MRSTPQQRVLLCIAVNTMAFGASCTGVRKTFEKDATPAYYCGIWSVVTSTQLGIVLFEIFFSVALLWSLLKRRPMALWAELALMLVGWGAVLIDTVWYGVKCVDELKHQTRSSSFAWFVKANDGENFAPLALIAVDIGLCVWALIRVWLRSRAFEEQKEEIDFDHKFLPEQSLRRMALLNFEVSVPVVCSGVWGVTLSRGAALGQVRSLHETVAPIRVFPASFILFSGFSIGVAVALSHEISSPFSYWSVVAAVMLMFTALRGVVFFVAFFWCGRFGPCLRLPPRNSSILLANRDPAVRSLLSPSAFFARLSSRLRQARVTLTKAPSQKVRFGDTLEEHLLSPDEMYTYDDREHSDAAAAPHPGETDAPDDASTSGEDSAVQLRRVKFASP